MNINKPIMILEKTAEKTTNKIRIPKAVIKNCGRKFCMEIYNDKIILTPMKG